MGHLGLGGQVLSEDAAMRGEQLRNRRHDRRRDNRVQGSELLEDRRMLAQTTGLFFNNAGSTDGYTLFAPNTSHSTYLIDKDGDVVNTWTSEYLPGLNAYLQPDGSLLRDGSPHGQSGNGFINAPGAGGLMERFDWEGNKNWEFAYDSPTVLAHHDFEVMPNGNILLIAWEYKTEAQATAAGRDPNLPGPGYMYPDHIVEVHPDYVNGGGTIVWQWHIWDHLVQEFDPTKGNYHGPTGVEDNPQLIDVNYVSTFDEGSSPGEDWTHANGIDYNAELDQIVLSVREFSEFWIIDHSTTAAEAAGHSGGNSGRGGDLLYRWGNPQTYDRGTAADRQLYYQHDPRWIDDGTPGAGHITVFNNGIGRPGQDFTAVYEIAPPLQEDGSYAISAGQAWGPAAPAWVYTAPLANFSAIISSTQRLANGNTLVVYGVKGTMTEVTPDGVEVWKYVSPYAGDQVIGAEQTIPPLGVNDPLIGSLFVNFTFQAQFYPQEYLAQFASTVADRHLFYNQSKFDGLSSAINAADDGAIAPDKEAYFAGSGVSSFANVSSYSRGINGVMIDLAGMHGNITTSDFTFRVGGNNTLASWTAAPSPAAITVRGGAGAEGSDRIEIVWPAGAVRNQWLEITLAANSSTGLLTPDVFYFGSRVGDTGLETPTDWFLTSPLDAEAIFANVGSQKTVGSIYDFNRDGQVSSTDGMLAFSIQGVLFKLDLPGNIAVGLPLAARQDQDLRNAIAAMAVAAAGASVPATGGALLSGADHREDDDGVTTRDSDATIRQGTSLAPRFSKVRAAAVDAALAGAKHGDKLLDEILA
jgi:hypothetical protein